MGAKAFPFNDILQRLDLAPPFVGPKELERRRGRPYRARLGANENLFGVSPKVLAAVDAHMKEQMLYSDPFHHELRSAIAEKWARPMEQIVVAEGIEGLLNLFVRAFVNAGDRVVRVNGSYPSIEYYVQGVGGQIERVEYTASLGIAVETLLAAADKHQAKLIYLANPDNPTGATLSSESIRQLLMQLPENCMLLLDEAYADYMAEGDVLPLDENHRQLVRLRTFSKLFGLAGARVGFAVADEGVISTLEKIRLHFGVSKLSQEMALAAFGDEAYLADMLNRNREGVEDYRNMARALSIKTLPSETNFVAFDFGTPERASRIAQQLEEKDVFVVRPSVLPVSRTIRVTVDEFEQRRYFERMLREAMDGDCT